ncbi:MAG: hypothetical protein M3Z41_02290 [Candidatus Eremiobacteraeota bacterium]|nr:hypothetical protein [Candidatus Eremiobacteraeota bacterium]
MSPDYLTAFASLGTFLVIAVTAIAAVVQLRHIRASNQLAGMLYYVKFWETDAFQRANTFINVELAAKLRDPDYRRELLGGTIDRTAHPELVAADWCEQAGSCIKYGLIAEAQFLDLCGAYVDGTWEALKEVVAIRRVALGPALYENFEYIAALGKRWGRTHKRGNYPNRVPRLLSDEEASALTGSMRAQSDASKGAAD